YAATGTSVPQTTKAHAITDQRATYHLGTSAVGCLALSMAPTCRRVTHRTQGLGSRAGGHIGPVLWSPDLGRRVPAASILDEEQRRTHANEGDSPGHACVGGSLRARYPIPTQVRLAGRSPSGCRGCPASDG